MGFLVSSAINLVKWSQRNQVGHMGSCGVIHNVNYVLVSDPWLL